MENPCQTTVCDNRNGHMHFFLEQSGWHLGYLPSVGGKLAWEIERQWHKHNSFATQGITQSCLKELVFGLFHLERPHLGILQEMDYVMFQ